MDIFIFFIIINSIIYKTKHDEYDDDDEAGNIRYINNTKIIGHSNKEETKSQNDTEDYFPMRYIVNQNSAEVFAHSNKILTCEDHSSAKNVCSRINSSSLCYENEVYSFSFCRKSCGFCDEIDNIKHELWRIVAGTSFRPTWPISELKFYSKYPLRDTELDISSTFASSSYQGYDSGSAFDNNNGTYWIPLDWGYHAAESEWIGANVSEKTKVNAFKVSFKNIDGVELPKSIHVESSSSLYEPFIRRWTYHIGANDSSSVYVKPTCPPTWKKHTTINNTFCVKTFGNHLTWDQANFNCKKNDANLISFHSLDDLTNFLKYKKLRGLTWIGLNDRKMKGKYEWSDGSKAEFYNWGKGEANDEMRSEKEDCVHVNEKGEFSTSMCQNRFFYTCKKPYSKYEEPVIDPQEPEVLAPIILRPDDYYGPVINDSRHVNLSVKYESDWPKFAKIPISMDKNTTYQNRFNQFPQSVVFGNDSEKNLTEENLPEQEKIEAPIHRYIQKKRRHFGIIS